MLKNPNFKWMLTYTEPDLPFDFIKDIYWWYMYAKIERQGTQEDVHRLVELYDESNTGTVTVPGKWFSLDFNAWFHHRYAVVSFISEQRRLDHEDELRRERTAREAALNAVPDVPDVQYGVDWNALRKEFELLQVELDAAGAHDAVRNTPVKAVNPLIADGQHEYRQGADANVLMKNGKLVKTLDLQLNGMFRRDADGVLRQEKVRVYVDIYDKYQGVWSAILLNEAHPTCANGRFGECLLVEANSLVDPERRRGGMVHMLREALYSEQVAMDIQDWEVRGKADAQLGHYLNEKLNKAAKECAKSQSRSRRTAKGPDISKVQKALGVIDDNCGDDLDGDIF